MADTISELKLGNGTSILIFANIASSLPSSVGAALTQAADKDSSVLGVYALAWLLTTLGIVYVQDAERQIPITYASRYRAGALQQQAYLPFKVAARALGAAAGLGLRRRLRVLSRHPEAEALRVGRLGDEHAVERRGSCPQLHPIHAALLHSLAALAACSPPSQVNATGVMPVIFSSSLLALPASLARYTNSPALEGAAQALSPAGSLYLPANVALIVAFNYLYTFLQVAEPRPARRAGACMRVACTGPQALPLIFGMLTRQHGAAQLAELHFCTTTF